MAIVSTNRKRRFSNKPVSSSNPTISKHSKSPATKFHTRCRGFLRFKLLVRASILQRKTKPRDCCNNEEINRETINLIGNNKATLRLHEKDSEAQKFEDEEEHSSNWGVRNGKNGNNLRVALLRLVEVSNEPFIPLKEDEVAEVKGAFSPKNRLKVLVSHENSNIDIRGETLQCLMPTRWLNDELVSASGYNYEAVRRWTTQRKLGYELIDCDIIFVPIHGSLHWTLAVINIKEHKFMYLDSLNGVNPKILKALAKYLVDEVKNKSGKNIDVSSWDFEYVKDLPRQQNGYDCGMFMLKYIDFYSRGLKLQFSQKDMPYFRLRTAKEILRLGAY